MTNMMSNKTLGKYEQKNIIAKVFHYNYNGLKITPRGKILNVIKWLESNEF